MGPFDQIRESRERRRVGLWQRETFPNTIGGFALPATPRRGDKLTVGAGTVPVGGPQVTAGAGRGAYATIERAATQSVASGGAAISFDQAEGTDTPRGFGTLTYPLTRLPVLAPGYYGGTVEITWADFFPTTVTWKRWRGGIGTTLRTETDPSGLTSKTREGGLWMVPFETGDELEVLVDHGQGTSQNLSSALLRFGLVDLAVPAVSTSEPASGPLAWYEADDSGESAGTMTGWQDNSGNSHNLGVNGGAPQLVDAQLNGLPVVEFDGDDFFETTVPWTAESTIHVFAVVNHDTVSGNDYRWLGGGGSNDIGAGAVSSGQWNIEEWSSGSFSAGTSTTGWILFEGVWDGTDWEILIDGTSLGTSTETTVGPNSFMLGQGGSSSSWFDGKLAEVIFYAGMTAEGRTQTRQYLQNKWGV